MADNDVLAVKERRVKDILSIAGVTGVGVLRSSSQRIIVYVKDVGSALKVPVKVDDIPVVSVVTGVLRILPLQTVQLMSLQALTAGRTNRWRPMPGGVSLGHPLITAGTSAVYTKNGFILSNNHVQAAANQASIGDPIIQPGKYDGGKDPDDRIATLSGYVRVEYTPAVNYVDCAVSKPVSPADVSAAILDVGEVYGWGDAAVHQTVWKSGRTTGLTSSTVIDVDATLKIAGYPGGDAVFSDQVVFENPNWIAIAPGDSGSLLFTYVSGMPVAVGLCFAGSNQVGCANKMSRVIDLQRIDMGSKIDVPPPTGLEAIPSFLPIAFPLGMILSAESQKWSR